MRHTVLRYVVMILASGWHATARAEDELIAPPQQAWTVETFERWALEANPVLAKAAASIEVARGRQIQAGLYPNPTIEYIGSEMGNEGRAGQHGFGFRQEIVRGNKLRLSRSVAAFEREQAEAIAQAETIRVLSAIRSTFYSVLAAEQTLALTRELGKLAEQGVGVARQRERAGEGTLTETLQAQIELEQVRMLEVSSANEYRAAWRRLAALVGRPELEPTQLAGQLELTRDDQDEVEILARLVASSPEVQVAEAAIRRTQAAAARARVEPIPNLSLEAATQYDHATRDPIATLGISLPLPVWDRNQGNILAAEFDHVRAQRELDRVKMSLAERLAAAMARYRNALERVERYGQQLPAAEAKRILTLPADERQKALDAHPQILPRAQLALALATEGWQRGEFGYLNVLTAQRVLAQASLAQVRALAELRQSAVAIDGFLLIAPTGDSATELDSASPATHSVD